jgi:hypothetical protein
MNRILWKAKLSLEQGRADPTVSLNLMNMFQVTGRDDARTTKEVELDGISKERVELESKTRLLSRKIREGATASAARVLEPPVGRVSDKGGCLCVS